MPIHSANVRAAAEAASKAKNFVSNVVEVATRPADTEIDTDTEPDGPLSLLSQNRFKDVSLQWPLNIESAEESHWVRFDLQTIKGTQMHQDEGRTTSVGGIGGGIGGGSGSSFLDRIIAGTAEKASALITTALLAPINIAKSTVNEFLNDLPPVLGGVGRSLLGGFAGRSKTSSYGSITLYSPHTRQENFKVNWKGQDLGLAGSLLSNKGGSRGLASAISAANSGTNEALETLLANIPTLGLAGASKIAGAFTGGNTEAITKTVFKYTGAGQAINPHLEMFFENVDFRSFTFDFKLAPRNAPEAKAISKIINLFKYAAAPSYQSGGGGVFFIYPHVFDITFFNENETHKIATSCLTGVNVNYTGPGINSTFYDNYPLETHLNLTFTELEIMHKGKIGKGY